jgi:integrase/recombinase XerC
VSTNHAIARLYELNPGALALVLANYKAHLQDRHLSASTINLHFAAIKALLLVGRRLGANCADPTGLVTAERRQPMRDTRGPSLDEVRAMLALPDRETLMGARDFALLVLMAENALRRAEVVECNLEHLNLSQQRLSICGKGAGVGRAEVTLSLVCLQAIRDYRGALEATQPDYSPDTPLFVSLARGAGASRGTGRLSSRGLAKIVNRYGVTATGRRIAPHMLRHAAITALLDATGGDVRQAQRLSRHSDIRTLQRYDDNRTDMQGAASNLLSDLLHKGKT